MLRQHRLQRFDPVGACSRSLSECLLVQLDCLHGRVPGRHVARRIVTDGLALLAAHEYDALARLLDLDIDQVMEGVHLVLSLDARPGASLAPAPTGYIVPDVVAWHADCAWPKPGWGVEDRYAIRLSIGLEDPQDLIADLERGFAAMNEG